MASGSHIEHTIFRSLHPVLGLDLLLNSKCYRWAMARQWERVGAAATADIPYLPTPSLRALQDVMPSASLPSPKISPRFLSRLALSQRPWFSLRERYSWEHYNFTHWPGIKALLNCFSYPVGGCDDPTMPVHMEYPPLPWLLCCAYWDESAGHLTACSMIYWQDMVMSCSFATVYRQRWTYVMKDVDACMSGKRVELLW